jgi:hypothetical protein
MLSDKIRDCGSWLHLREWIQCDGQTRLINANFCKKHLLCRSCAIRRAARLIHAYLRKIEAVMAANPGLIPAMVTLTIKNGSNLSERIQHFKRGWSLMLAAKRRGCSAKYRHQPVEWNKVQGSLRAMETTVGKDGLWHPHAHAFVLLETYIDQAKLSQEWEQWTGDSKIVGVTLCKNGIKEGLREVLKYTVKFSALNFEQLYHLFLTLNGTRSIDPQGCLRGVNEPDIDQDDVEPELTGETRDFLANWLWKDRRYDLQPYTARDNYAADRQEPARDLSALEADAIPY